MKMYEVLALQNFYASVQDKKMPIKTTYKLSRLARRAEEESQFYQKEFARIVDEYAQKQNGELLNRILTKKISIDEENRKVEMEKTKKYFIERWNYKNRGFWYIKEYFR